MSIIQQFSPSIKKKKKKKKKKIAMEERLNTRF